MGGKKKAYSAKALPAARKSSRSRSRSPSKKKGGSGKKKSKSASAPTAAKKPVDIMSPAAMSNAYYIAHGAQELLEMRGFTWPDASKKKKKKGGGKKKKKKK